MNTVRPHIKFRVVVLMLVVLSLISTLHIWYHYQSDELISESVTFFQLADTVKIKEVGFINFIVEVVHRVIVIIA